jgi:hypothetical protein
MTGISLHMQWPLTSQFHGSVSQREQLVFRYGSNSTPKWVELTKSHFPLLQCLRHFSAPCTSSAIEKKTFLFTLCLCTYIVWNKNTFLYTLYLHRINLKIVFFRKLSLPRMKFKKTPACAHNTLSEIYLHILNKTGQSSSQGVKALPRREFLKTHVGANFVPMWRIGTNWAGRHC